MSSEDWADLTVRAIQKAAYTGDYGDGKIFTYEVRSARKSVQVRQVMMQYSSRNNLGI